MRKYSTLGVFASRMLCVCILSALLLFTNNSFSQGCPGVLPCGASPFGESAGVLTPIANFDQNAVVGSGTYSVINTHGGGIYTFSTCGGAWADSYLTGFLTGTSSCLFYNDDNGPAGCSPATKASQTYSPSVNTFINVQLNRKVSGSCQAWVSGGSSGQLTYRCAPPVSPTPATFGNGQWNVYVWNAGGQFAANAWGADATSYSGYLTSGSLNFNSLNHWASGGSPSDAASYQGCHVGVDDHSWSAKRTGFTCGVYRIDIPTHDDACELYVNGVQIAAGTHIAACCDAHLNAWTGVLTSTSTVEFRVSEGTVGSVGEINIVPISPTTLSAGTVGTGQTICTGGDPAAFTSNSLASGGVGTAYIGGSYTYTWGYQDNCTGGGVAVGSGTTYDAPAGLTVDRCYYRVVTDACGNDVVTSPIFIDVVADPAPNAPTLTNTTICAGGSSTANVTYSGGTGSPTYSWEYFNGSTWNAVVNGTPAGATYSGNSTANLTIGGISGAGAYQYRAQVGATGSGCGTTASAGVTLTVVADPTLSAAVVATPTICTGGSTNITSTVSNGTGIIAYQWEYDNGGTWVPVANGLPAGAVYVNASTATLNVSGISVAGTYNFRNTVTASGSGCNPIQSTQGTLTVVNDPAITTPTLSNSIICTTGSSVISATVSGGTGAQTLQWQYNNGGTWVNVSNGLPTGAVYSGNNTASLTVSGIVPLGSYQYQLVFTSAGSSCATATSSTATLNVAAGPSVTTPAFTNSTICVGGSTSASVTASGGTGTTTYQWQYFNGSWANVVNGTPAGASYTGATTATLNISGTTATGTHQYQVIVSASGAGCTPTTSAASTVTVVPDPTLSAPSITNSSICSGGGSTTVSSVISDGTGTISYQWEYNNGGVWGAVANGLPTGAVYVNATTNTMDISGVTAVGTHQYRLAVTASGSGCNATNSSAVSLNVLFDPSVTNPIFTNSSICVGGTTNISAVGLNGTGTYGYQWQYFNAGAWNNVTNGVPAGVTYTNPTASTMTIAGITATGTHQYQLIVTASGSGCDPVTSLAGTLTVNPDPAISISGAQTYCVSGTALLSSVTSGGAVSNTIQWQDSPDGITFTDIPGANGSTFTTPVVTDTTFYRATYASTGNGCGTATSNIVTIIVQPAIANNTIAPYQKFCASGDPVVITAGALTGGNGSYTYAWEQSTNGGVSWSPATGINNQPTYDPPFTSSTIRYRRTVTSGVCSSTSNETLILVLPLPQVNSVNPTNVLCFGTSTGTINVTGSTANGSVYYSKDGGSTYQISGNFTGLPIGSYDIFVRDDSSCVNSFVGNSVVLTEPTDVTHTAVAIDASCANVFDGQISITANGGITPYSYSLNGGPTQSGSVFLGLTSGTYLISVFDANGCLDTSSITINNSYAVTGSILSQTNVSCFGGSDGAVTVQLSGGISPYVYSLNGGAFVSSQTFTGLPANLYVVTLRDSKGCTDFLSVNITQPAQLAVTIDVINNVLCNGDTTGEIFISVNGGTPAYTYNWSNGRTTQDNLNVGVGTYLLTVTDSKGCTTFASASVTQPQLLSLSIAQVQNLRCFNDNSGRVDISVSGGVSPYTYVWSNGASTEDIINLPAGNYTVSVYDGNGCMKSVTVPVTQPAALTTTISGNTIACNGGSTGIVDLTVFGGTPGYTYLWSNGFTSQDLAGVPAGIYNVIVNDANGCTTSNSYNVAQPGSLTLSTLITNVNCFGDSTGTVNLSVSGGVLPYTYTWSNGATTQSIINIPAGNYSVSVVDGNGCTVTAGATVTQPNQGLATTLTQTDVTCNGSNNGAVNLGVSGGTLPYSFAWSNGAGTEDLANVGPNTYYVTVTDFKGCTIRDTAVVNEPAVLTGTISPTNVTCFGGNNGAVDLTVTGGNPGYTYLWSPFASTQDLTNVTAGTYNVVITDTKGCQTIAGVTITQPAQIVLTAAVTNVDCNGAGNGAINLTVTGGVGPFTYSWNSGAFTTEDLSSLSPGTYNVLVTDFNGCTATGSYTITQPAFLNVVGVPTDVTCNGAANGAINVTITGGTTPYTIIWSNGAVSEDLTGLSGGLYDISVTDANGCTNSANFVVQEPIALTATVAPTNVSCFGGNNGAANLTASGGNPPYTFLWSNFASTEDLLNLTAGNYTVIVTDSKGCQTIAGTTVTQPAQIVLSAVITNINCNGSGTGAIDLTATGGTGTLTYSWNGGLYTTEDLTNLGPGTYTVVVTDANLCTASATYTITQPLPLASSGTVTNVSCFGGANGAINFTISGGNAPFTYIWSNGATTEDVSGLIAGTYSVSATDANGCVALDTFSVTEPTAITSSVAGTNVSCFGASNGGADLTVSGGVAPYTYLWNNFQATQDLINISGGTYYVIITDANGCTKRDSVIITEPAQLALTSLDTNVLCNGAATGAVDLSVTGGTGAYTYLWSNGATTQDLTGVAAGTYTVTVIDANGCTAARTVTITQPAGLVLNATTTNVACFGGANGSVDITVNGGVFPYTFAWSNGTTTEDVNGLSGGPISVTVTDANGCTITQSYNITEPAVLTSSVVGTNVTCFGAGNGAATLTVSGGVTPYTFLWSNFQATQNLSNISGGTYYVVITDANGCTKRDSVIITEPSQIVLSSVITNINCNGSGTGAIDLTATGGTGTLTYSWNGGLYTTEDLTNLGPGTYTVIVTDANLCTASATYTITQPLPLASSGTVTNVSCFGGANGAINFTISGGNAPFTYIWSNGATTEDVSGLIAGTYSVSATDANGCVALDTFSVTEPTAITSSVAGTNVSCFGASNGAATLSVSGGVTPYTFLWNTFQNTQNLSNIAGGTYYVIITDANGCTKRDSVIITEPAQLVLTSLDTNVLCNGAATGAVDLSVTGGTGAYTYLWSNGATTQDLTGVAAGTYTVTVTDANGCTVARTVTITQPAGLVLNATTTNVACFGGANGSVDITVNGGVFPYTFAWSNGTTTEDVNGLSGGPISVTVTDANSCTITQSYNITEPTILVSSISSTNVSCYGASDGTANLTVSGGVTPYTFLWSNFQATQNLTNISGGTYYVVITDANGCTKRDSITILEPTQLVLTTIDTNVLCNGAATGAIDLTVTGGAGTYTYVWSNGSTAEDISGVTAGTYTVTVTDFNGCTATRTVTLTQPAGLVLNATTTNVNCFGGANGSVDITVNGGVFPYTFAWSNGTTTEDVNGLSGGPISVTVTDANGCTITQSYNITEPTILVSSVVGTNVTCFGASNGAANLTVSGGVAPYTYLWNTFQNTQNLNNIGGGTYYVIITDANGCTKRDSVIITEPTQLVLSTSVTNILCSGNNTGAIDLTVNGGTANYTYLWSNGATTQDLAGLAAGTYTVTVTDANGCTATISATVSQPNALAVTGVVSNVFCAGGNDGNINLSVTGGAQPYTFLWTNGAVTEDLLNLTQGTYTVTVTDANGCTATATFNVTEPTGITSSVVGTDVACQGANNGTATLTVNGGVPPYTFFWSNFQNTQSITGLDGGIYYVIITDANGCTRRDSVIINEPSPLILSYTSNNVSCFNANDGNIDLTVVGGISSYTYLWSNGATTQDISNLAGNTYSVTVTDNNGCTATTSVLIINPSPLSANFITQNPTCFLGNNGSINLLPTGGTPNYTFLWNTTATTEDITNLANGLYIVTITDSKNCTLVDSVNIVEPAPLVTSGFVRNVTCFGYADGFIDITAYGGTLPYTYLWSSTPSTEDIGGLVGGNYIVTVTDFNSCTVASLYVVSEPTQLTLNVTGTNVSCFAGTDGTAAAIPGGGVTPYDYLWDDFAVDSFRVNLAAGKHAVLLTDSNGCQVVDSIILTQPVDITIQGSVTNVACASAATGAIDITVGGGTPTYTYVWSNAAVTEDISGVPAGNYAVQVTDLNGCVKAAAFEITQPKGISTQLLTDQPSCFSSKNGSASVIASEGVAPYTFVWSTTPVQTGNTANFIGAGTYVVTVTDANACTVSASVAIVEPDSIAVSTTAQASKCFNTATGLVIADVTGGEAPYIYSLNGVTQLSDTFTNLAPGSYIIEATDLNGCSGTAIFNIAEASQITVDLVTSEFTLLTGMETQLVANTNSTTPVIAHFWNPDSLINFNDCSDPANCSTPYAAPRTTTLYTVTVMNADSCTASDTVTIYVTNELSAFMPSVFTPNGDGLNDRFEFDVLGAEVLKITVFDRWGGLVYSNDNQPNGITGTNGWDGTRDGKVASADTYVYYLTITYFDGNTKDVSGTITLMK